MLRIGLVGCGFIGRVHGWGLWAVRKAARAEAAVVAVADADRGKAAALAELHDAVVVDVDSLLDAVDVVYVCTPTAQHAAVVEAAAGRGLAVFCEKPLAPDLPSARRVAAALAKTRHQVGLVLRHAPVFAAISEAIGSGRYGRPMAAVLRDDQYFPIQGQYGSAWRADRGIAGGGTLIEHSIHDLDLLRWLRGDPSTVACRTSSFFGHPGIEDLAVATLGYDDGSTAGLVSVWHQILTRGSSRRLEVFCEDAFLWTEDDNCGSLHVETSRGAEIVPCDPPAWVDEIPVPESKRRTLGLYAEASRCFLACIEAGSTGSPGEGDALAAHVLVDAAYRSAADAGRPITV
ncbi:MAG: Gfo/Idh/MocA family protein [Actinomycetota bacterium]